MRYAKLALHLGGSPLQWAREKERDLKIYAAITNSIIRKRKMNQVEEEMRAKGGLKW